MVTKGLKLKISALETLYSGHVINSVDEIKVSFVINCFQRPKFLSSSWYVFLNPFSASVFNSWRPLTFQCWFSVVEDTPLRMLPGAGRFCYWLSVIWIALIVWWSAVRSAVTDQNHLRWPHWLIGKSQRTTEKMRGAMIRLFCALDLIGENFSTNHGEQSPTTFNTQSSVFG